MIRLRHNVQFLVFVYLFFICTANAEDLAAAVAAGKVSATFQGTGGSTGDSVMVTVKKKNSVGGDITLTIPTGTRLESRNSSEQDMVISSVRGVMMGEGTYSPNSVIQASSSPQTYILDAYCAELDKNNPSTGNSFSLGTVDPQLACILSEAKNLSAEAKQAAVWIYTDKAEFNHVNNKFNVSKSDWHVAESVARKCQAKKKR